VLAMRRWMVVVIGLVMVAGCDRVGGEAFQQSVNGALRLDDRTLSQTFRPATAAVRGVDLLVATYGAAPDPAGVLQVRLLDPDAELARARVEGSRLMDNTWLHVAFAEPVTAPEVAAIEVSWDGATPVGLWANTPPAEIAEGRLVNDPYPGGELLVDGERAAGDLAFRVRGDGGAARLPRALAGIAAGALRGLGDRPLFAAGWGLGLLCAVGLAAYGFAQRRPDEEDGEHEERGPAEAGELADEPR
jgi:hypothetical protein